MADAYSITPIIIIFLGFSVPLNGHPQCLDYRPPFETDRQQSFCSQYQGFGCCTDAEDSELMQKYRHVSNELLNRGLWHCSTYARNLICQTCSPYAAHIYDAEATRQARTFPGLCEDHCRMLYRTCREALYVVMAATNVGADLIASLNSEDKFCSAVNLTDVDYCYPDLLQNPALTEKIDIITVNSEGCLCLEDFAKGLHNPLVMRYPDDDTGRIFIGEQTGTILVFLDNKTRLEEPFLDIMNNVFERGWRGDERGLLGLEFHPQFAINQRFFVFYFTKDGGDKVRISEFTVSVDDPNKADAESERIIIEVDEPYVNHNGGELLFGDDGYLYIFVGDGGSGGDPQGNAQNKSVLLGKVLRIDVDTGGPNISYTIPADNPFVNESDSRPEIYAYGIRNIWRCGKDRGDRTTGEGKGRIICGDVGQSAFEEIDIIKKGGNYGWRAREGFQCFDNDLCGNIGREELPIYAYPHRIGKSITGGHMYRGCDSPNLQGFYIYGDYFSGGLFRLLENPQTGRWKNKRIDICGSDYCINGLHSHYDAWILSFGEDPRGEIYVLSSSSSKSRNPDGGVYKIVDPVRNHSPSNLEERNLKFELPEVEMVLRRGNPNICDRRGESARTTDSWGNNMQADGTMDTADVSYPPTKYTEVLDKQPKQTDNNPNGSMSARSNIVWVLGILCLVVHGS